jgi:hypothetical protein
MHTPIQPAVCKYDVARFNEAMSNFFHLDDDGMASTQLFLPIDFSLLDLVQISNNQELSYDFLHYSGTRG